MNTQKSKVDFAAIHKMADAAGKAAALALVPNPMVVSNGTKNYYVPEGVCGFAWVKFAGNTDWGRWTKKTGIARKSYEGGLTIWVSDYDQSMQKKEAYARAYAAKLREKGIEAHAQSRMD